MSVEPACVPPECDPETCPWLLHPLPIEFLVEADTCRECFDGLVVRSEASGRGTAYLNASIVRGTDFECRIGPVPGSGTECPVTSCHGAVDSCVPHDNDSCPSC